MKSGGVNWWGYAVGEAWLLITIVATITLAAIWYLVGRHLSKNGHRGSS